MEIKFWLNGEKTQIQAEPDALLLDVLRSLGCDSVKRGCETANCGLCTVVMEDRPVVSFNMEAAST